MLRVLDLFAGIGGMSYGLERTGGFETVGFCEIDPFCRRVLAKHWPNVWCHDDIRTLTADIVRERCGRVDLVCGGFPCQDISNAGRRAGIGGERSGLWSEMCRIIGELRPGWALVENVAAIIGRGLDAVLGDLAEIGYDAEWHCIPADTAGAPHLRDRIWIFSYPRIGEGGDRCEFAMQRRRAQQTEQARMVSVSIPHPQLPRLERAGLRQTIADSPRWLPEPGVSRVVDGVSGGVDRLASLGNAVVPQVVEAIGRAILAAGMEETR